MTNLMREYEELCTLGLPTSEVVPLAVSLLDRMIGGNYSGFGWVDEQLEVTDLYLLNPMSEASTTLYFSEFHNRRETEVVPGFKDSLKNKIPLVNYARMGKDLYRSALYNDYFAMVGIFNSLRVSVFDHDKCFGVLLSARPRHDPHYTPNDEQTYCQAARLLAQAFELEHVRKLVCGETVEPKPEGFLLLDSAGKILHGSELGLKWFHDATQCRGLATAVREALLQQLAAEVGKSCVAGEIVVSNSCGQFVFRPLKLHSVNNTGDTLIAVTVKRRYSMGTFIWVESGRFNLSGRERQVAAMLGVGYKNEAIALHLGVGLTTVITYIERIFQKVGIRKREQLLKMLLMKETG